jgi:uncharacterized protein
MEMFEVYLPFADAEFNVLVLVLLGLAVGVLAGFFGMGGGWIVTPVLNIFGFPMVVAVGTELANITCQSGVATVKHRKMGNVEWVLGVTVGVAMMGGVELGKRLMVWLDAGGKADPIVRWVYIAFLGGLGCFVLWDYFRSKRQAAAGDGARRGGPLTRIHLAPMLTLRKSGLRVSLWMLTVLGICIGFLAGIMGCGGGFALVPAFVFLIGTPTLVAVGTSLVCVMLSGAYGAFTFGLLGRVEVVAVLWMVLGSIIGTQFGTAAVRHVKGAGIRLLYGVMLFVAMLGVLLMQFGMQVAAGWVTLGGAVAMCMIIVGRMFVAVLAERRDGQADDEGTAAA